MKAKFKLLHYLLLTLSFAFTAGGCATLYEIGNDYDEAAVFQSYQTYAWYTPEAPQTEGLDAPAYDSGLDQQIRAAVESGLVKNGLRPTSSTPGLYLAYDVTLANEPVTPAAAPTPGFGYGYGYWFGYRYNYTAANFPNLRTIDSFSPGTVVVDIIDATTNELVWRGWAEAAIDPSKVDSNKINRVVASIMAQYPPVIGTSY